MKKIIKFSFPLLMAISVNGFPAFIGNEVGNGGNSVRCGKSWELLDFYEAKLASSHNTVSTANSTLSEQILSNLNKVDPKRAEIFKRGIDSFVKNAQFLKGIELTKINDSYHLAVGKGCEVFQTVILNKNAGSGEQKFLVNKDIWDQLPLIHQEGLKFHEIVYEYFSLLGEKDSIKTRKYNAFLFSPHFQEISKKDYWNFIRKLKIPIYQTN